MNTQVASTLKKDMTAYVTKDSLAMVIHVKTSMSVKTKLIAATKTLNVQILLARFLSPNLPNNL